MKNTHSIKGQIEMGLSSMSHIEKKVAEYFLKDANLKSDLSIKNISEILHVSQSTLTRFSKKCGFTGYREFLFEFQNSQQYFEYNFVNFQNRLTQEIFVDYNDIIEKTNLLVDERQLERVAQMINQASRVYLCGAGSSGLVAREIKIRLMRLGVVCEVVNDLDSLNWTKGLLNDTCLFIGYSISGHTKLVNEALINASTNGAKSILFTTLTAQTFPISEVVRVASVKNIEYGNRISPQFPMLLMMDIIYSYFLMINQEEKESIFSKTFSD